MKKSSEKRYPIVFVVLAVIGLFALLVLSVWLITTKGLVGAMFISDFIAGIIAFAAAYVGTKSNPSMRSLLMLAILFFVLARLAQIRTI